MREKHLFFAGFVLATIFGIWSFALAEAEQASESSRKGTLDLNIIKVPDFPSPTISELERRIPLSFGKGDIRIPYQLSEVSLPPDVTQEASKALQEVLLQLVKGDERYAKRLGFKSEGEVQNCMLGRPLQVFEIGLDRLRAYEPGPSSLANLFKNRVVTYKEKNPVPIRLIYPICVKDKPTCTAKTVRSSVIITFSPNDGKWHVGGLGLGELIKSLFRYKNGNEDSFMVWIPALNGYYLGNYYQNSMQIFPLVKDPRFPYKPGIQVPENFFTVLKEEAQRIDEKKPH